MTKVTNTRVLKIAIPIVISNATVPILGAVDTGVVGQAGLAVPIGAVGIGAIILSAYYWIFGFLRMGTVGLTSQAYGSGDAVEVDALLSRALLIGLGAGLCMIALQFPLFLLAFQVSPASAEVETLARQYMGIRIWSAPAAIAMYGITGWLIAQERTRGVLLLQVWMNGVNIVLDLWFVLGLDLGVEGVAYATLIAEWSGLLLGLFLCRAVFRRPHWVNKAQVFDAVRLKRMAVVNTDILLRSVMLQAIFVSFLFYGAGFGDVTLAANQVLLQFLEITAFALDGFAFAAEALVGAALGAKQQSELRRGAMLTSLWGGAICIGLSVVFFVFGPTLIDIMTTAPDVRSEARVFLIYMVLSPILGIGAWMLDGIFIGATRTKDMRNMMFISAVIYFVSAAVLMNAFGNHGLWMAMLVSFVVRGVTLAIKYPALEASAA